MNNIGFAFPSREFAPGIIALVTPNGSAQRVADDVAFSNGMAVTSEQRTLMWPSPTGTGRLTAFDIASGGTLSNRRVCADLGDEHPDGICRDVEGAVCTQPRVRSTAFASPKAVKCYKRPNLTEGASPACSGGQMVERFSL